MIYSIQRCHGQGIDLNQASQGKASVPGPPPGPPPDTAPGVDDHSDDESLSPRFEGPVPKLHLGSLKRVEEEKFERLSHSSQDFGPVGPLYMKPRSKSKARHTPPGRSDNVQVDDEASDGIYRVALPPGLHQVTPDCIKQLNLTEDNPTFEEFNVRIADGRGRDPYCARYPEEDELNIIDGEALLRTIWQSDIYSILKLT